MNGFASNTGMNLLRAAIAPLAERKPFFRSIVISGSHLASIKAIVDVWRFRAYVVHETPWAFRATLLIPVSESQIIREKSSLDGPEGSIRPIRFGHDFSSIP